MIVAEGTESAAIAGVSGGAGLFVKAASLGKFAAIGRAVKDNQALKCIAPLAEAFETWGIRMARWFGTSLCFPAGTMVHTDAGLKPIESLAIGDRVLTRDDSSTETGPADRYEPVIALLPSEHSVLYDVEVEHSDGHTETIRSTGNHPFFVVNQIDAELAAAETRSQLAEGNATICETEQRPTEAIAGPAVGRFTEVVDLRVGDALQRSDGCLARIKCLTRQALDRIVATYNFTVASAHAYYVGEIGIWVHNTGDAECVKLAKRLEELVDEGKSQDEALAVLRSEFPNTTAEHFDDAGDLFREWSAIQGLPVTGSWASLESELEETAGRAIQRRGETLLGLKTWPSVKSCKFTEKEQTQQISLALTAAGNGPLQRSRHLVGVLVQMLVKR